MNPNLSKASRPDEIPVVLKPSLEAMNIAIDAAEVDPHHTVTAEYSTHTIFFLCIFNLDGRIYTLN